MLSDDITRVAGAAVGTVVNAVRGAVKGALIVGAIAAAVGIGGWLLAGGAPAVGALSMYMAAHAHVGAAAAMGAMVMGVTSLIPGSREGLSLRRMFRKRDESLSDLVPVRQPEVARAPAVQQATGAENQEYLAVPNPYYRPGAGAEALRRSQEATAQGAGVVRS